MANSDEGARRACALAIAAEWPYAERAMGQDATRNQPPSLSPIEVGLLTVAARRGSVATPEVVDHRNDPTALARSNTLKRLQDEGLLAVAPTEVRGEIAYVLTDAGRAALAAIDAARPPNP
jgi:hypothetical protein